MMRRPRGISSIAFVPLLVFAPFVVRSQTAVTVTGHVFAAGSPVRGASVKIEALDLSTTTNGEGRYSFIVPSSRVRGQVVPLTVSYSRYKKQSLDIELVGGSLVRDFDLSTPGNSNDRRPDATPADTGRARPLRTSATDIRIENERATVQFATVPSWSPGFTVDSSAFTPVAGSTTLPSALSGRVPGLDVQTSSTPGGTTSMILRGQRSVLGLTQPLVVVNGIIVDNSNLTSASQRTGSGGFDYGTTLNDFNLEDVAFVEVLSGPAAAMRFGGRGANGALLVHTRNARGLNGFEVSGSQQFSNSKVLRRPVYQNLYGQGLKGLFSYFDGKGGGVNDTTDQSWGPALNGAPVTQASFAEAGRPEVRPFVALPDNVRDYFGTARTVATTVAFQGGSERGHLRASISNQTDNGITPGTALTRRSVGATGDVSINDRLNITSDLQAYTSRGEDRPGSGFDESNAVSGFSHLPRQLNVDIFQIRTRDETGAQVSFNYSGRNNPYFASVENDNHDDRTRFIGGGSINYRLSSALSATLRGGADHATEHRSFSVASGWMGGFPYYLGRGDFSTGGFQNDDITRTASNLDLILQASPARSGPFSFVASGGAGYRADELSTVVRGTDRLADANASAPLSSRYNLGTGAVFASVDTRFRRAVNVVVSGRQEVASPDAGSSVSTFYPAVLASVDLTGFDSLPSTSSRLQSLVLHAGWSRSGNDAIGAQLQRISGAQSGSLSGQARLEITAGWEVGATATVFGNRVTLDATAYTERSRDLALDVNFANTGVIANKGVSATAAFAPTRIAGGLEWSTRFTVSHNENTVESLSNGVRSITLGAPPFSGLSVVAQPGYSLGTLVGTRYLRDAGGQLLLREGRPLADSVAGPVVLGESEPAWLGGISSSLTRGWFSVDLLLDARHGGKIFSASNRAGAYSGVLDETSFRPDSGLLIAGNDVSGIPNTIHVSTEDYYHALGAIAERWLYDASYVKLREARLTLTVPLLRVPRLQARSLHLALVGRNLALWTNAPNIDPESVLSTSTFRGAELGQLPSTRTIGVQVTLSP